MGNRLDARRGLGHALGSVFRVAYRRGPGCVSNPTFALVASHEGNRKARALVVLMMLSVLVAIGWMYRLDQVDRTTGNFAFVPADARGMRRHAVSRQQLVVQRPRAQ